MATRKRYRGGNWLRFKSDETAAAFITAGPDNVHRALTTPAGEHELDRRPGGIRTLDDMTAKERAALAKQYGVPVAKSEPELMRCGSCGRGFSGRRSDGKKSRRCWECVARLARRNMAMWNAWKRRMKT